MYAVCCATCRDGGQAARGADGSGDGHGAIHATRRRCVPGDSGLARDRVPGQCAARGGSSNRSSSAPATAVGLLRQLRRRVGVLAQARQDVLRSATREELTARGPSPVGLQVIDLRDGRIAHWLRLEGQVIEYDVVVLPKYIEAYGARLPDGRDCQLWPWDLQGSCKHARPYAGLRWAVRKPSACLSRRGKPQSRCGRPEFSGTGFLDPRQESRPA